MIKEKLKDYDEPDISFAKLKKIFWDINKNNSWKSNNNLNLNYFIDKFRQFYNGTHEKGVNYAKLHLPEQFKNAKDLFCIPQKKPKIGGRRRTRKHRGIIQAGGKAGKKVRKHKAIHQSGGNKGKLKKGYKYTGRRHKNGKAEIVKVTKK